MTSFVIRRLWYSILTLFGITVAVFAMIHAVPGDPVQLYLGGPAARNATPEVVEEIRQEFGLDDPLPLQYARWLGASLGGDLGRSFTSGRPVIETIAEKTPATVELNLVALLLAALIGIPAGVIAGSNPGSRFDRSSNAIVFILFALPNFWVALVLMNYLSVELRLFPLFGMQSSGAYRLPPLARLTDHLHHLVLPAIVLAYAQIAVFLRFTRTAVGEVIGREYVAAARARGVPERRILFGHALRNAMIPLVTLFGLAIPTLISGSVIIEQIFEWDGLGRLYFTSILARDYPMIMGLTLVTGIFVLLASVATDVLYGLVDPRIRSGGEQES
ncbi:MAG: ABC transporter permease [Thermoanaerobaculia bacterium]|nr:ABC transporter permease [Thermoanaerobaculia bacterium]